RESPELLAHGQVDCWFKRVECAPDGGRVFDRDRPPSVLPGELHPRARDPPRRGTARSVLVDGERCRASLEVQLDLRSGEPWRRRSLRGLTKDGASAVRMTDDREAVSADRRLPKEGFVRGAPLYAGAVDEEW